MLKVTSAFDIHFFPRLTENQALCSILGKAIAKHCYFPLNEVTVIRTTHSFLIVNKRAKVVCEF